jgi:hypothetical protein
VEGQSKSGPAAVHQLTKHQGAHDKEHELREKWQSVVVVRLHGGTRHGVIVGAALQREPRRATAPKTSPSHRKQKV